MLAAPRFWRNAMNNVFDKQNRETQKLEPLFGGLTPLTISRSRYYRQMTSLYGSSSRQNLGGRESLLMNHLPASVTPAGKRQNSVSPARRLAVQKLDVGDDDVYVMDGVLVTNAAGRKVLMPGLDSDSGSGGGITPSSSGNRHFRKNKEICKVRPDFGHSQELVNPQQFAHGKGDVRISSPMILNKPEVHSSDSYTHIGWYSLSPLLSHQNKPGAASASTQQEIVYSSRQFVHGKEDTYIKCFPMMESKPEAPLSKLYAPPGASIHCLISPLAQQFISGRTTSGSALTPPPARHSASVTETPVSTFKQKLIGSTETPTSISEKTGNSFFPAMGNTSEAHSSGTLFNYSLKSPISATGSGSTHTPSSASASETPASKLKPRPSSITPISKSENNGQALPSTLTPASTSETLTSTFNPRLTGNTIMPISKSENTGKTLPPTPTSTQTPASKSEKTFKTLPSTSTSTLKAESSSTATIIPTQDWSPLDDGIEVALPFQTKNPLSGEEIDMAIQNVLYHPSKTTQRLPVFSEICLDDKLPNTGKF